MIMVTPGMSTPPYSRSIPSSRNTRRSGAKTSRCTRSSTLATPVHRTSSRDSLRTSRRSHPTCRLPLRPIPWLPSLTRSLRRSRPACRTRVRVSAHCSPITQATVYLANSAAHPNLEFSITNFSQLYLAETGHALTPSSVIGIGAFAGNDSTATSATRTSPRTPSRSPRPPCRCPPASTPSRRRRS